MINDQRVPAEHCATLKGGQSRNTILSKTISVRYRLLPQDGNNSTRLAILLLH